MIVVDDDIAARIAFGAWPDGLPDDDIALPASVPQAEETWMATPRRARRRVRILSTSITGRASRHSKSSRRCCGCPGCPVRSPECHRP